MQIDSLLVNDHMGLNEEIIKPKIESAKTHEDEFDTKNQSHQEDNVEKTQQEVLKKLEGSNSEIKHRETSLEYSIHKETNTVMIKIIDKEANKVINELPPEKILNMVADMIKRNGLFVDEKR